MPPANDLDPPVAAALAPDEGEPPRPARRPLSLTSMLLFGLYLTAVAFLLPRLLPSFSCPSPPPPRHISYIVTGVMKLDDDLSLFTVTSRPFGVAPTHRVLILPGLAAGALSFRHVYHSLATRGLLAAVIDFPGQGRSLGPRPRTGLLRVLKELIGHGVFNAVERLFQITSEPRPPFPYAPAEAAAAVARAAEALGIGPAHLVVHDSALAAGAAFASANPGVVQSVTLIDTGAAAFPAAVFRVPLLQELVLMVPPLFRGLLWMCCVRGIGAEAAREHRMVMMRKTQGVVEASRALNRSFDLGMWRSSSEEVRSLPMMVLWSRTWSERWRKEGKKVAALLPDAKFIYHSGSRWPQEDAPEEISELITKFVTSFEETGGDYIQPQVTWDWEQY